MKRLLFPIVALAALALPALAQQREFLTTGEIAEIREAQEPNDRLKLYVMFAKARIETITKLLQSKDANRGDQMHDALYEYDRILDAIDKNVDEAQNRRDLFRKGLEYALKEEPDFLKQLQALQAANPADLEQYRFVLGQAIGDTQDNLEGLAQVLNKQPKGRKEEKEAKTAKERDQRIPPPRQATPSNTTDPNSRPGWDPTKGPPTRKKNPPPPDGN